MNIIIETHIFLWYIRNNGKLDDQYKKIISDKSNNIFLSIASIWECIIKQQIGKLNIPLPVSHYLIAKRNEHLIFSLSINEGSIVKLESLPYIHKDPFDRIILSQALSGNYKIITKDHLLKKYPYSIFL